MLKTNTLSRNNKLNTLNPVCATFLVEVCNPITHQAIELESCSNPLRIQQVFVVVTRVPLYFLNIKFNGSNLASSGGIFWM